MSSRELILQRVREAQPNHQTLLPVYPARATTENTPLIFKQMLQSIGGQVHFVNDQEALVQHLNNLYSDGRIVTTIPELPFEIVSTNHEPHSLENVRLAIIPSTLAVAENGAIWVTDHNYAVRALPFIAENLAVIIHAGEIVPTMHQAYSATANHVYGFGVFIAGPSKTADIEQSLVLGAHGSRSMHVYILP